MNCPRWQEELQRFLDGEAGALDQNEAQAHVKECADCRHLFLAARRLLAGLRQMPVAALPNRYTDRTVARVLRDRVRVLRPQWLLSAAAAVLVAALAVLAFRVMVAPEKRSESLMAAKGSRETSLPLEEVGSAALDLTWQVVEDTTESASILVPPAQMFPASLPLQIQPPSLPFGEAGQTVAVGLQPVTNSVRRAWDMFTRDLPSE